MKTVQQCAVFLFNFSQTITTQMKYKILTLLLLFTVISVAQQNLNIIPKPTYIKSGKGNFTLNKETVIQADENSFEAQYLQQVIKEKTGLNLRISSEYNKNSILFLLDFPDIDRFDKSRYELYIFRNKITLIASTKEGLFYGIQTFLQLIPSEKKEKIKLSCLTISDQPKFQWRGMHLDVSRHFFPKDFIKKYIDYLAMYKMNTFHWHLTDDQGWRIEIKQYPDLTSKGAYREETLIGHYNDTPQRFDGKPYGGFYTQQEVKEIVAFAKEHHVTIIPEIELPGHAQAAIHAYPDLGCTKEQVAVATKWGVFENIYCPKPETFTFLKDVLDEVMELFPGAYIHIGGDEAPKTNWKACPNCQKLITEKNLINEHGLQSYFITEIEKHINSKGKKIHQAALIGMSMGKEKQIELTHYVN
mgnify:CR=1 FL=1